jgi:hypothetical protein
MHPLSLILHISLTRQAIIKKPQKSAAPQKTQLAPYAKRAKEANRARAERRKEDRNPKGISQASIEKRLLCLITTFHTERTKSAQSPRSDLSEFKHRACWRPRIQPQGACLGFQGISPKGVLRPFGCSDF